MDYEPRGFWHKGVSEMNDKEITRMYLQVAAQVCEGAEWCCSGVDQPLQCFAALVAKAEREACAKVCDNMIMYGPVAEVQTRYNKAYADCRDAIRARSEK